MSVYVCVCGGGCEQIDRKRTKEDRELVSRLKVLSRFMTPVENDALTEGVLLARKLVRNIDQYATYRQMGIRSMEQVWCGGEGGGCVCEGNILIDRVMGWIGMD